MLLEHTGHVIRRQERLQLHVQVFLIQLPALLYPEREITLLLILSPPQLVGLPSEQPLPNLPLEITQQIPFLMEVE